MNNPNNNIISKKVLAFLLVVIFAVGYISGKSNNAEADQMFLLSGKSSEIVSDTDFSIFWKVWSLINQKYVATKIASSTASSTPSTPVTDQDRIYGAIKGMVASLGDPYTVFFTPKEASSFKTEIDGNFEGIGMEVGQKDGILTVISPLPGSPAEKAGIKTGDKIVKINDTITTDMSIDEAVQLIRGKKGTEVRITIFHEGGTQPVELKLIRDVINIPTIDNKYDAQNGIYTIKLYSFNANSEELFQTAIKDFAKSPSNKLIIDLRGNPGGFLDSAVSIASNFLPAGQIVVRENCRVNRRGICISF